MPLCTLWLRNEPQGAHNKYITEIGSQSPMGQRPLGPCVAALPCYSSHVLPKEPGTVRRQTVVSFSPYASALLLQQAKDFRAGNRAELSRSAKSWRAQWERPGTYPWLPLLADSYRIYVGGVALTLKVHGETDRAVGIFNEGARARELYALDTTYERRAASLCYLDDQWVLNTRHVSKRKTVPDLKRDGRIIERPEPIKPRRYRWKKAPEWWPRDKYGRPLPSRAAALRIQRERAAAGSAEGLGCAEPSDGADEDRP